MDAGPVVGGDGVQEAGQGNPVQAMVQQGGLTGQLPCLGSSFVVSLSLWGKGSRLTMHLNKVARDLSEFIA